MSRAADGASPRLPQLDLLRFIAALAVTLYHFSARAQGFWAAPEATVFPWLNQFSRYGFFGVHLFFMISGFVILLSAEGKTVAQFTSSRVARLYPAYWVAVALTGCALTVWAAAPLTVTGGQWLVNLTMLQAAVGVPAVDGVYWTLFVELRFYVAVAVLLAWGLTRHRLLLFCGGWLALNGLDMLVPLGRAGAWLNLAWTPWFCAGIILYCLRDSRARGALLIGYAVCWLLACAQALPAARHTLQTYAAVDASGWAVVTVVTMIFASVGLACSVGLPHRGLARVSTALGSLTYPLYLVHQYNGGLMISLLRAHLNPTLVLFLTIAAMCLAAWAIHALIERPAGPPLRRWVLRRLEARPFPWSPARSGIVLAPSSPRLLTPSSARD